MFCSRGQGGPLEHGRILDRPDYPGLIRSLRPTNGLTLTGDEPLLHPELHRIIEAARETGFRKIGITTSGLTLGRPGVAAELVARGISLFDLPLYGSTAAIHDAITGVPGSFDQVWNTIRVLRPLNAAVRLHSVLLRANLADAPMLSRLIKEKTFGPPIPFSSAVPRKDEEDYRRVAPTFSEVSATLHESGLELRYFPLCVTLDVNPGLAENPGRLAGTQALDPATRTKPESSCKGCRLYDQCGGAFRTHVAAYGVEGLTAL
jgi:MoaA/NifB/PqqE/SkfB family radical SAM enzyme